MNPTTLIELALSQGVELYAEQGKLKYRAAEKGFTPALRAQIRVQRDAILACLASAPAVDSSAPLSFEQQRLWFVDALDGGSPQYNMPMLMRLDGALDRAALTAAIGDVVARHQVLHTCFRSQEGTVQQVVQASVPFILPEVDLSALAPPAREALLEQAVIAQYARPFDLGQDLMLRGVCYTLAPHESALLLCFHHIACDGWSMGIFLRELDACYRARQAGITPTLPRMPLQYQGYARWQQEWHAAGGLTEALEYWRARLADLPALHGLPTDKPRPARQGTAGANHEQPLPMALLQALRSRAQRSQASLFILLHTTFALLLARYSGERDIVVGTPVAGRQRSELEQMIGLFATPLVLRSDVDLTLDFDALLERNRHAVLSDMAHQGFPFERLVEALAPQRDAGAHPLFQILFSLQKSGGRATPLGALVVRQDSRAIGIVKCDLELTVIEHDDGLLLSWSYQSELFDAGTVRQLAQSFEALLSGLVAQPGLAVGALPLVGTGHVAWLRGAVLAPLPEPTVHAIFEAHAARRPGALALSCSGRELDYGELNARANALAHALLGRGCGSGKVVACYLSEGVDQVTAILAVAKAGAACLPLDPDLPPRRVASLLQDCGADLLLHAGAPATDWPAFSLDGFDATAWSARNPEQDAEPNRPAYLVYTSGSSGLPKGVLVTHGQLAASTAARLQFYGAQGPALLLTASPGFDIFIGGLYWALCGGGRVEVLRYRVGTVDKVAVCAGAGRIDTLMMTASMYDALLAYGARPRVRTVVLGGERLEARLCVRHAIAAPDVELVNEYGPSEATVWCSAWRSTGMPAGAPPIGLPAPGYEVLILDAAQRVLPAGAAGELYIAGAGVAAGYQGRPELSAATFLALPGLGTRLYRTGDWGRVDADGQLHFLGRRDEQVKLRGHRIELGEIEAVLGQCEGVRDAAVLAPEVGDGSRQLVAYVTAHAGAGLEIRKLRAALQSRLPEYMVPSAFVTLEALPLTPNGKLDRKALPVPESDAGGRVHVAPRTPTESALADLWAELLGLPRSEIGAEDNFFGRGGHSLLAVRLKAAIASRMVKQLSIADIFFRPYLAEMARYIDATAPNWALAIEEVGERAFYPASSKQKTDWMFNHVLKARGCQSFNCQFPVFFRQVEPHLIAEALRSLVTRHEVLRTEIRVVDGTLVQTIHGSLPCAIAMPIHDLRQADDAQARFEAITAIERARTFDYERFPLFSAVTVRTPDVDCLVFTVDHICGDGHYFGILASELAATCQALAAGEERRLPSIPLNYKSYACWETSELSEEKSAWHAGYWRSLLSGYTFPCLSRAFSDFVPPFLSSYRATIDGQLRELPMAPATYFMREVHGALLNVPCKPIATARYRFHIGFDVYRGLQNQCRMHDCAMSAFIFAALGVWMHKLTGAPRVLMGMLASARAHGHLLDVPGCFIDDSLFMAEIDVGAPMFHTAHASQKQLAESSVHNIYSMAKVLADVDVSTDALGSIFLNYIAERAGDELAAFAPRHEAEGFPQLDINLAIAQFSNSVAFDCQYRCDIFRPETIESVFQYFLALLEELSNDFSIKVADLQPYRPVDPAHTFAIVAGSRRSPR